MDETQKEWLQSAYNTIQKAWRDDITRVEFVLEELKALEDAIALALEL